MDANGCSEISCFEGVTCTDNPAPLTGVTCGPCPAGLERDGAKCLGKTESKRQHLYSGYKNINAINDIIILSNLLKHLLLL